MYIYIYNIYIYHSYLFKYIYNIGNAYRTRINLCIYLLDLSIPSTMYSCWDHLRSSINQGPKSVSARASRKEHPEQGSPNQHNPPTRIVRSPSHGKPRLPPKSDPSDGSPVETRDNRRGPVRLDILMFLITG